MKQTAVEWLADSIDSGMSYREIFILIEQAKAMEKEQIIDAVDGFPLDKRNLNGQEYYNQIYKQNG
jgi:hypothetical protein